MFVPEIIKAGYLLAISATAPADKQHPHAPGCECLHFPTMTAAPTPTQSSVDPSSSSSQTLPGSCYTTWDDWVHTTATVKTHECYTRTSLVPPSSCPTLSCASPATDQVCPLYLMVSSITVPCATDCCPTTSTVYLESTPTSAASGIASSGSSGGSAVPACPKCEKCPIPTEWVTYTTGCVGTPTITEVNVVTPP